MLSTLWVFALFNYLYADFVTLMVSPATTEMARKMSQGVILGLAVLMETAIVMVLLCRVLPYAANRWANIIAGVIHTLFVASTLTGGVPKPYYVFFAAIEMVCTLFIVWYAWRWQAEQDQSLPVRYA
jgi:hypothetical protein